MNDHEWELLLDRYIRGGSLAEQALVRQELATRGESLAALDALRRAQERVAAATWSAPVPGRVPPAEVTAALAALDQRLVDAGLRPVMTRPRRFRLDRPARPAPWWAARGYGLRAAVVAGLVLAGTASAAWLVLRARPGASPLAESRAAPRAFATPRGQRAVFRLIDGTEVMLGVASRLRLPASYGVARRDVWLEGEAYFTVVHDATRPFVVHTARGMTRDLGTKFGVRAYREDPAEWVVVAEGAVAVAARPAAAAERRLRGGQLAVVSSAGAITVVERVDVGEELAWTRGELRFANTPLGAAIQRLGRWYDIDVQLADVTLADRPITGVYAGESLDQVLTLVTAAVNARFERHGKRVIISAMTGGRHP